MTPGLPLFLRRLIRLEQGVAAIEFALTGPVFLLLLMGIFDYSWQLYGRQVLHGAVAKAARDATLEKYAISQTALDNSVRDMVHSVYRDAEVRFSRKSYKSFAEAGDPEPFNDHNENGVRDSGECFEDINGNRRWDSDRGRDGNGGPDDIVLYTASMKIDRVLPVWRMLGQPQETTLTATTILPNQLFIGISDASPVQCE